MGNFSTLAVLLIGFASFQVILTQQLTSVDDKVFLDTLQSEIEADVSDATGTLVQHAKAVRAATEKYATTKLTHNIFMVNS